jgi:hypothetical protein
MTTICLMHRNTGPSHRVDQAVDCGLRNVVPLLFNGCVKLLDIDVNWNTLLYTSIQSIPNMLKWVTCLVSMQELCTGPYDMGDGGTAMGLLISN